MRASVHRFTMRDPGDVSQLADAIARGDINPAHIVAFIGKTEGNGLVNDYTRGFLVLSLKLLLAEDIPASVLQSQETKAALPPLAGALLKNEQDVTLFEKLMFMQRHNR